ncbi:DUF943 family protein [Pseudescherichia vulneris]|uniref:DUF943 family protein n=1 Tax=Pseudescherichia vulneris TaxID=566 RepID=UPI0028AC33EC|nr:DUF943 family protein [Pseudescherichia vulneris]
MKKIICLLFIIIASTTFYLWRDNVSVNIIAIHQNKYTAEVLVDRLPLTEKSRIKWWVDNRKEIEGKHHITSYENGGPDYITIFKFGDGYKKEGKKDRLCFDDMDTETNCIDKDILMTISRTREGLERFTFSDSSYVISSDGVIKPELN